MSAAVTSAADLTAAPTTDLPDPVAPVRPPVRAVNLATTLRQMARRYPGEPAVVQGERRISWSELDAMVDAQAADLHAAGIGRGNAVLVHSANHIDLIRTMYAIWRVGAVFAPTNFRLTPAEVADLARLCEPVALICHADYPEHARAIADAVPLRAGTWWIAGAGDQDRAIGGLPAATEPQPEATVMPGDHAWYFFTSGTSGRPKAAILTHDHMGFVVTNHLSDLMPGLTERDGHVVVAPLSHGAGIHLVTQVARGARTVLPTSSSFDAAEIWRLVEQERVSTIFTVPTILTMLAQSPAVTEHDHSSLRYVIYAGAPMYQHDQQYARQRLGDVLVQYYGLGEVTGNITVLTPEDHGRPSPEGVEFGTCGVPRTGMQVSIQDDDGAEVAVGVQGEICVAGPAVFGGYLNNPAANQDSFRSGWFRTGDLGMVDESGYLYVTGRASDMYISGGSNIYPRELEEKVLRHPDVGEVAVLGMPDPQWGEVGVAVCVPAAGCQIDAEALRDWMGGQMARYKVPKRVVVWDELPKSGYGKVVKRTLAQMLTEETP